MSRLSVRGLALLALFAFSAGVSAARDLPAQTSSQAGVTVKVTPRALNAGAWEFEVVFDTHSGDLKDELPKSAALASDGGTPAPASAWQGDAPGGHHRKGVLRFKPVAESPANIELRLQRPGEAAPRTFRWQVR